MRLIDADELREAWLEWNPYEIIEANTVLESIDQAETIDAVEVVHGRWANNGISELMLCKCTVCGSPCSAYAFNYCPNCGAKMDGDENGTLD